METAKCRICRRLGTKLFLKGERCLSQKCAIVRNPFPPGQKLKKSRRTSSEYGKELREKQKLKNWYNLRERQFRNYVKEILGKRGKVEDASLLLMKKLAVRLDNVVFKMGFAPSRKQAKQMVSHNHFLVNGKKVNVPSYEVKTGDIIGLAPSSQKKALFKNLKENFKRYKAPVWIEFNAEKLEGKIISEPTSEELTPPAEILSIFEFYSR